MFSSCDLTAHGKAQVQFKQHQPLAQLGSRAASAGRAQFQPSTKARNWAQASEDLSAAFTMGPNPEAPTPAAPTAAPAASAAVPPAEDGPAPGQEDSPAQATGTGGEESKTSLGFLLGSHPSPAFLALLPTAHVGCCPPSAALTPLPGEGSSCLSVCLSVSLSLSFSELLI